MPRTINEFVISPIIDLVVPMEEEGEVCRKVKVFKGPGLGQVEVEAE